MEKPLRILVVDDRADVRQATAYILQSAGYDVGEAASGAQGVGKALEFRPDLVLSDVVMPDIDGPELCRRIKSTPELVGTLVVLISAAKISSDNQIEGFDGGADGYITRPIANTELLARIRAFERIARTEASLRISLENEIRARESLSQSEQHFRLLVEHSPYAILVETRGRFTYVNPQAMLLFGAVKPEELVGHRVLDYVAPEYRDVVQAHIEILNRDHAPVPPMEQVYLRLDGTRVHVDSSAVPLVYQGEPGAMAFFRDITRQKETERSLQHMRESLQVLLECNEALVRAQSEQDLFEKICRIAVECGGYRMACVGCITEGEESVRPVAQYSCDDAHGTNWDTLWSDTEGGPGPAKSAVCSGCPCVHNDLPNDPDPWTWRKQASDRGCASVASFPLAYSGDCLGVLVLASAESHAFSDDVVQLFRQLADDMAMGLTTLRSRTERNTLANRLQMALDSAHMATWEWSPADRSNHWDSRMGPLFGLEPKPRGLSSEDLLQLVHPEDRARFEREGYRSLEQGNRWDTQFRVAWPDGSIHHLAARAQCSAGADGLPVRMLGVCWDVTHREQAEQTLRESEEKYRRIVETANEGIWVVDSEYRITFVNPRMAEFLGYAIEEMVGQPTNRFVVDEDQPELNDRIERRRAGKRERYELRLLRKDGSVGHFWLSASPLREFDGRFAGSFAMLADITEQRKSEERLQETQSQLAHVARLSMGGELLAEIAHEVNQPLCAIVNYAKASNHLLKAETLDRKSLDQWNVQIATAAAHAGEIIRRINDFVRRKEPSDEAVAVGDLIHEAVEMVKFEARRRRIHVHEEVGEVPPVIYMDRIQIHQVLVNLLHNAYEALENRPGERHVTIAAKMEGASIIFTVSDNGPGISTTEASRLFEPFVTTKSQGLGMGLAISKSIVNSHGGRLWAATNPNGGATLAFNLPRSRRT